MVITLRPKSCHVATPEEDDVDHHETSKKSEKNHK